MFYNNSHYDNMDSILVPYGTAVDLFDGGDFTAYLGTLVGQNFTDDR